MWKRTKNAGPTVNRLTVTRRRSKTHGVMITQYTVNMPEGKSTPDFQCKPIPVTLKEGKLAVFKATVTGDPKPEVSWRRAKGTMSDKDKFQSKYDESTGEHILEIHKVSAVESDTYKCFAVNEFGKAVCTTTLNVIEASSNPSDFRKLLRKSKVEQADGETDERFWDAMVKADRRDYERICAEFGVKDINLVLTKLEQKKKERVQNKCKDGVIPNDGGETERHMFKSGGTKGPGLKQVDEEEIFLPTDFKLSNVDFVIKIQEIKAQEREDALFECVLTHPLPRITWMGKGSTLEDGEKYSITVSDHKLIHRLLIKDCTQLDKSIYSAVAGITSCSAWLLVEAESERASAGKDKGRKNTLARGARIDLEKVAMEQQIKIRDEMGKILASVKSKQDGRQLKGEQTLPTCGKDGKTNAVTGQVEKSGAATDKPNAEKASSPSELAASKGKAKIKIFNEDGTVRELNVSDCETEDDINYPSHKKHSRYGQEGFDKVTDTNEEGYSDNEDFTGSANNSKYRKHDHKSGHTGIDSSGKMLDDIELNHTEVTDCDGNEDLPGVVGRQRQKKKVHWKQHASVCGSDTNNLASDNEASDSAENEDSTDLVKNSSCSKKSQKPQRAVNVRGSATVPHKQASDNDTGDNDASDGDGDEDSADLAKQSSRSKQSQKPQRAVNVCGSATVPNKQASDNDASDIDGDEDSTDQVKHSSRSNQSQKPKKVDNVCGPDTIPHKLASDNGARQSGENEDSTGLAKHSSCPRQSRKPQKTVNDPHKLASDNDESDSGENEDSTGLAKHSSCSRKSRKPQKTNNDPHKLASDNDESDNDENEDSTGLAKHSSCSRKSRKPQKTNNDPHKLASDNDESDNDENEDSTGLAKHSSCSRKSRKPQKAANGESTDPEDNNECDETEDATGSASHSRRKRQGPLIEDTMIDPGVQFIWGLSDVNAVINETAEISCKLSSEDCEGAWFTAGKKIHPDDNFTITKDGAIHKLIIIRCKEEHSGKYRFEADGRKTVAMINVKDPPRFDPEDIRAFVEPLTVKVGHNAIFKMHFVGHDPIKIQWYKEGEELQDDNNTRIEKSTHHSRLLLSRCQRRDTGEIKIKLKNEHGFTEKISQLIVLDKPTSPLGPAEVTESSARCIEFKWRPPKDDGGSPVINYIMERQQVGRNTWKKIGEIPGVPSYRDTDVEHGRKYCYRIWAVTAEGTSEVLETDDMQAGTLAFPGPPSPPVVVSAYDDCINISWVPPANRGGSRILGYILEKRKKGSNLWTVVNAMDELIKENKYGVKDVVAGLEYEFRVTAINLSGVGEFSTPSEFVFARDPKKPPGKVTGLKVTETSYNHMVLTWTKPEERPEIQDEAKGYFVQIRQAECLEWTLCNTTPNLTTSYSVKGLKPMDMYWVKVIATNDGGDSAPEELANYVLAMPSPVRPKFTNHKMKSFMVVRAGNTVRITVNFEASPRPNIMWLKDNVPVTKRVTISNSDGSSQLLIPSSERSDSGIYSILVKNLAGQETFCTEVRVTDDPKPPGPVELEENVPGTVTVTWEPSPDEKRDDRLHYAVSKLDSTKRTWTIVAERLFNNKFTVCNIMHGRLYHFRVYAKNDMGVSAHSESPTWGMEKKKEKFVVSLPSRKDCDLRCAPTFLVPLKLHTAPKGYECYMSCAVKGNPKPRITWYRNHISLNTNTNYYISDTCGVCSMLILHVGPKDMGEYTISAENALGRAECSTVLSVRE